MKNLTLSIMPTYMCNYNCQYCYLGGLRKDRTTLDLLTLQDRINELEKEYHISNVNLFGGELSLLDNQYLNDLVCIPNCKRTSLTTNLSNEDIINFCLTRNIKANVSLNEERDYYKDTLKKVQKYKKTKIIDLSVVVLPSLLNKSTKTLYKFYDNLGLDVLFIQYHKSIHNEKYNVSLKEYSDFMFNFIKEYYNHQKHNFNIENLIIYNDASYSPTKDSYLFITPDGKYSTVVFNNGVEHYIKFDTLKEWKRHCEKEMLMYKAKCFTCNMFKKCKAEHLEVLNNYGECSGLKELMAKITTIKDCSFN